MQTIPAQTGQAHSSEFDCSFEAVRQASLQAREFLAGVGLSEEELGAWELALAEAANNAVSNVKPDGASRPLRVDVTCSVAWVEVRVLDHTPGFDLPEEVGLPSDDSESGRGLFLIHALTDEVHYFRGRGENILLMRKRRAPTASTAAVPVAVPAAPLATEGETQQLLDAMTEELASAYESLAAIFRFSAELHGGTGSNEFIRHWLKQLLVITDSDWFVLRLAERNTPQLRLAVVLDEGGDPETPPPESIATTAPGVETRSIAARSDVWFDANSPLSPPDPIAHFGGGGSGFAHPLFVNDALVGVLTIGRRDEAKPFEAGKVSVVQTIADFLAIQIRSQQILEQQVRARVDARDLEIAANIQRMLLPQQLPKLRGAVLAGFCRSAREIGGDYYDALPTSDGNLLLIMADVMGKGLPAALFSLMFRSLVRSRRDLANRPARVPGMVEPESLCGIRVGRNVHHRSIGVHRHPRRLDTGGQRGTSTPPAGHRRWLHRRGSVQRASAGYQ